MNVSKALENVFVENPIMQTSNKKKDNSIFRFYTLKCQFVPQPKPRASLLPEAQVEERRHDRHFKAQPETVVCFQWYSISTICWQWNHPRYSPQGHFQDWESFLSANG